MSTDNFQWTDELVIEFARFTNTDAPTFQGRYADIEQFKASKQPKQERIEISDIFEANTNIGRKTYSGYAFTSTSVISTDKFPAIKNLLERYLNGEMDNPNPSSLNSKEYKESWAGQQEKVKEEKMKELFKKEYAEPSALPTKEYEILSFSGKIANYGFTSSPRTEEWVNKQIEEGYPIHSVRRLSDNVVFQVGDNVLHTNNVTKREGIIESFRILTHGNARPLFVKTNNYDVPLCYINPTPTEPVVTDNSDVACLSIKDVFSCYDDGSYIQHIPTDSALYKKLEQKVNQKLKQ